ncbi:MAG TPA: ABC transporter ATP-binding protein, partial [Clostridiaceae bacterium]|nr:ABC transporter ATP-binding protein [Clostridiaceae bacterium]
TLSDIFEKENHHPYTDGLFDSIPDMTKKTERLNPIKGMMPDPINLPIGCKFHARCPKAFDICPIQHPRNYSIDESHSIRCHLFANDYSIRNNE